MCSPANAALLNRSLTAAEEAVHNIQDSLFCARMTARFNALRETYTTNGIPLQTKVERFIAEPATAAFSPIHRIGENFAKRTGNSREKMPVSADILEARSLADVAAAFHQPAPALDRLNRENGWDRGTQLPPGTVVRLPDAGFAPWLAARFAADVLTDATVSSYDKVDLIKRMVPIAALSPTALDTVLARLLLAVRATDAKFIGELRQHVMNAKLPVIETTHANLPS